MRHPGRHLQATCHKSGACRASGLPGSPSEKIGEEQCFPGAWAPGPSPAGLRGTRCGSVLSWGCWQCLPQGASPPEASAANRERGSRQLAKVPCGGYCCAEFKPVRLLLVLTKEDFPQLNGVNYLNSNIQDIEESNFCHIPSDVTEMQTNWIQVIMQTEKKNKDCPELNKQIQSPVSEVCVWEQWFITVESASKAQPLDSEGFRQKDCNMDF